MPNRDLTEIHDHISGNHGLCYIADCFDIFGSIGDNEFDLMLTDPPYNTNFRLASQSGDDKKKSAEDFGEKIFYKDVFTDEEYLKLSKNWFSEAMRIAKRVIFTPGINPNNLKLWLTIKVPDAVFCHYKKNGMGVTSLARFARWEPMLLYGEFNHQFDFRCNVFDVPVESGDDKFHAIHPSPKPYELYYKIVKRSIEKHGTENLIDPFMGSGTNAQVCEALGIDWMGIELDREYVMRDITRRINLGKRLRKEELRKKKQKSISTFFK